MANNPSRDQPTLPEKVALQPADNGNISDNEAEMAINIANQARTDWNKARKAEIDSAKRLQSKSVQQQMANELFEAIITHLKSIPQPVAELVIAKFHAINLPKKVIVL